MSTSTTPPDDSDDGLTTEDKELFEGLAEAYEDEDPQFAEVCTRLAQSIEVSKS